MMMKKISAILPALLACIALPAQNGITEDFNARAEDFIKGEVRMSIPDTLQEFDYHFDYSVFDSPYKGAYEFSPYFVKMTPDKSVYDGRTFRLRGGAGYSFHPVLDFVWTPVRTDRTSLSVFNAGKGYAGNFIFGPTGDAFTGYDFSDRLSFRSDYIGKSFYSRLSGGWNGIFSKTESGRSAFNALNLDLEVKSKTNSPSFFYYDFDMGYRYETDNIASAGRMSGHDISLKGCIGPVIQKKFRFLVDFNGELELLQGPQATAARSRHFIASVTPRFVLDAGPLHLDGGAVLDYSHAVKNLFSLSPVVKVSVTIVKDVFDFYAGFVGGQKMHTYSSLKEYNHFASAFVPEVTQVRYDAFGGFKGAVGTHFDYNVKAGYMVVDNALLDFYTIQFGDVSKLYIDFSAAWRSERLEIDGDFSFAPKRALYSGTGFSTPGYKGDVRALYNWSRRIFAGASLRTISARKSPDKVFNWMPWYIDLGVLFEYKISRSVGLWLEGGNLLGHKVYDTPGYFVKGPYFTVGISCSL